MKKLLSAALMMIMLVAAAVFAGSVLAAEPYVFTPEGDNPKYPVVYFDSENGTLADSAPISASTDSTKAYKTMGAAVAALEKSNAAGGYVILVSDYYLNSSSADKNAFSMPFGDYTFPTHKKMIILRGMTRQDNTKSKFYLGGMPASDGPLWLQNLEYTSMSWGDTYLQMRGNDFYFGTPGGDYNDVYAAKATDACNIIQVILGGDGGTLNKSPVANFYSGKLNFVFKFIGGYQPTTINGNITVNNYGCDMNAGGTFKAGHILEDRLKGDFTLNILGGKVGNIELSCGGTESFIDGDVAVNISGTPDLSALSINMAGCKGIKKLDLVNYKGADLNAVANRISGSFNTVFSAVAYVSKNGNDENAGNTEDKPVKTIEKAAQIIGNENGCIFILDDVAINGGWAAHSGQIILAGANANSSVSISGDFVLPGNVTFDAIKLVNGGNGAIVAAGKPLRISSSVTTAPSQDGTYLDIIGGKRNEICTINIDIAAGTYNKILSRCLSEGSKVNISDKVKVIEFGPADDYVMYSDKLTSAVNTNGTDIKTASFTVGNVAKFAPSAASDVSAEYKFIIDGSASNISPEAIPFVRVEYYLYARQGEEFNNCYPVISMNGQNIVSETPLVVNEWGVALFDLSSVKQRASNFVFSPYGEAEEIKEWNKMYISSIVFSQGYNDDVPQYQVPDMRDDGEVVPYVFDPAEKGLEVLPVVYYAEGGTYSGEASGSINSLNCYGSLPAAFSAIDKVGGGYIILVSDILVNTTDSDIYPKTAALPAHTNMVILRGMEKKTGDKIKLSIGGVSNTGGPLWLQNLEYRSISSSDTALQARGTTFNYGTPGGDYNDVVMTRADGVPNDSPFTMVLGGGDNVVCDSVNISIYSGTVKGQIKVVSGYGGATVLGNVTLNIYGGDLSGAIFKNGHSTNSYANTKGDFNLTITGGKLPESLCIANSLNLVSGDNPSYIGGNVNVKISGNPDISALKVNGISAQKLVKDATWDHYGIGDIRGPADLGVAGTRTIDILEYEGDFEALKKKINLNDFDVRNVNSIYVKDNGNGDGTSPDNAFGNLSDAIAACSKEIEVEPGRKVIEGGRIVICGNGYTIDEEISEGVEHGNNILYTSVNGASLKFASGTLNLEGPVTFNNIKIQNTDGEPAYIVAGGNSVVFGSNVEGGATNGEFVSVVAGLLDGEVDSTNLVINSGKFQDVITGDSVKGKSSITINGGKVYGEVIGGTSAEDGVVGSALITINGGNFYGDITGGNAGENGVIKQTAITEINGGTFSSDTTITAGNTNETATIASNAEINITGGDFSEMSSGHIQAGSGTVNDKICVDYRNYTGNVNALVNAIASKGFDVIAEIPVEKPVFTSANKFIFIIQHIGDPTKALTKSVSVNATQVVNQLLAPIVSPQKVVPSVDNEDDVWVEEELIQSATPVVVDGSKLINSAGSSASFGSRVVEFEGKKAVMITPKKVDTALTIDCSVVYGDTELTPNGALNLKTHRYAIISYYYKSNGDTDRIPEFELLGGRIQDKINVTNGVIAKGTEALKRNEWATAVVKLTGNGKGVLTSGFNLKPLGNISASALSYGDVLYIENITFVSNRP